MQGRTMRSTLTTSVSMEKARKERKVSRENPTLRKVHSKIKLTFVDLYRIERLHC